MSQLAAGAQLLRGGGAEQEVLHASGSQDTSNAECVCVCVPVTGVCVTLRHCHNSCADIPAVFAAPLGSLLIGYRRTGWERRSTSEDPHTHTHSVVLLL